MVTIANLTVNMLADNRRVGWRTEERTSHGATSFLSPRVIYDQVSCKAFYLRRPSGERVRLDIPAEVGPLDGRVTASLKLAFRFPPPHNDVEIVQDERLTQTKARSVEAALHAVGGRLQSAAPGEATK